VFQCCFQKSSRLAGCPFSLGRDTVCGKWKCKCELGGVHELNIMSNALFKWLSVSASTDDVPEMAM
jgi:hypothetical protein